jgi:hypothetical protein
MPGGQMVGLRRRKHAVLLALLVVALAIETISAQSGAERLRSDALRTVLGVAIWIVVFERPREGATMATQLRQLQTAHQLPFEGGRLPPAVCPLRQLPMDRAICAR